MDLDFNEEQIMLRETTAAICARHYDLPTVRAMESNESGYPPVFWQAVLESGLTGLVVPENYQGAGLGLLDAVVVCEELGRHLAASPLFSSAIIGAQTLQQFGDSTQQQQWLPAIAAGDAVIATAYQEPNSNEIALSLDQGRLNGVKTLVPFAATATHLLVIARHNDAIVPCLVAREHSGIHIERQPNIASAAVFRVTFDNVETLDGLITDNSHERWQTIMSYGAVLLAAEAAGGAEQMLEITAEYAKTRVQFGKPIGAFQSLAHAMAELATEITGAKTLVWQAAWAYDNHRPWQLLAAQAKLQAGDAFRHATATGTQIHGGLGFTREADPQLYFRRGKFLQLNHWDPDYLERHIADLLDQ